MYEVKRIESEQSFHLLAYLFAGSVFLTLSILTLRQFLVGDGFFIYRDLAWPTDDRDLLIDLFYSLDLESLRRTIYLGPIFALADMIGLSSLDTEKLMFTLVRFLTGFLAFIAIHRFMSLRVDQRNVYTSDAVLLVSILGGFFYAYNPVATTMVSPTLGFAFSYSLMPLTFYFFDKSLYQSNFRNILITSSLVTLTLAGTTQYLVLLPLFLLLPWFVMTMLLPANRTLRKQMIKTAVCSGAFVLVFSTYWIVPAVAARTGGIALQPQKYIVSTDFLDVVSSRTPLDKVVRLMGDWWPRVEVAPLFHEGVWTVITFSIPLSVISFVTFQRKSKYRFYILAFFLISILLIFFNKGTQTPVSSVYPLLLDLPLIGWMFRIPSKFAMILAFATTMIISLGFYGILATRLKGIVRIVKPVVLITFVSCVCIISWPMFTGDLGGVITENLYPSTYTEAAATPPLSISQKSDNFAVVGGLQKAPLLRGSLQGPNSIVFLDQDLKNNAYELTAIENVVIDEKLNFLMHLLPEESIVLNPYDATSRYAPREVLSKGRTDYALNGSFPINYLDRFAISSRDLDFGRGLVFTVTDDSLRVPFTVAQDGTYDVFIRYMKSHAGGMINVRLDELPLQSVSTLDDKDGFVWKQLGAVILDHGSHSLSLESVRGFNAVNVVVLVPSEKVPEMENAMDQMLLNGQSRLIYLLGPHDLRVQGKEIGEILLEPSASEDPGIDSYSTVVSIPEQSSQMTLQFLIRPGDDSDKALLEISSLQLFPLANREILFLSDFETDGTTAQFYHNSSSLTVTTENESPLSGRKSLRVEVERGTDTDFDVVSSDLISLSTARGLLNTRMFVNTKDVYQTEGKLVYFDHNKIPISESTVYSLAGYNAKTFYIIDSAIPYDAKFFQLQFLTRTNPDSRSSFVVDVVTVEQRYPDRSHKYEIFGDSRPLQEGGLIRVTEDSVSFETGRNPPELTKEGFYLISSQPIDVSPGLRYAVGANLHSENVESVAFRLMYLSQETARAPGSDQPLSGTLILAEGDEATATLEVLRPSNYEIGILAGGCQFECPSLTLSFGDIGQETVQLPAVAESFDWTYLTKFLPAGNIPLSISASGGSAVLQTIVLVSNPESPGRSLMVDTDSATRLEMERNAPAATITEMAQLNPSTFSAKISAESPFILKLEQPYHSMWRAQIHGTTYEPVRVLSEEQGLSNIVEHTPFPAANGFLIDKTGELEVTVKYQLHEWYWIGLFITGFAFAGSFGFIIWHEILSYARSRNGLMKRRI